MTKFAYVENNEVKSIHPQLPRSWRNITGFHYLEKTDLSRLLQYGWYPVTTKTAVFDEDTQIHQGYSYIIHESFVEEEPVVVDLTSEQLQEKFMQLKNEFFINLRIARDLLLQQSDWTQLADVQATKTDDWKNAWTDYRQALRDLPSTYENLESYKDVEITYPTVPV